MILTQVRHNTMLISYAGKRFLLDPVLAPKGTWQGNPLSDLTVRVPQLLDVDAILLTSLRYDHFDPIARNVIPKNKKIFVGTEKAAKTLAGEGFVNVEVLTDETLFDMILLRLCPARSPWDDSDVWGIFMEHPSEKITYISGDTVFCEEVNETIRRLVPRGMILSCGGPANKTLDGEGFINCFKAFPKARMVATGMEDYSNCTLTRTALTDLAIKNGIQKKFLAPKDGETFYL